MKLLSPLIKISEIYALRSSRIIIVRGIALFNHIRKSLCIKNLIIIIRDPVQVKAFYKRTNDYIENRYNVTRKKLTIGYGGGIEKYNIKNKNYVRGWELIEVLDYFRQKNITDVRCIFIGAGSAISELQNEITNRGISENCIFSGKLSDDEYAMHISSIDVGFREDYALPPYRLNIGMKIQEYMSAGKLVITGENEDRKYMLSNTQGMSFFFKPLNFESEVGSTSYVNGITEKFEFVYNNIDKLRELGDQNREFAYQNFDVEVVKNKFLELYSDLIRKP